VKEKKAIPSMGFNFDKAIEVLSGAFVPSEKEKIWMKALYDGEIRYVDDSLGRLFNALKKMDIYNDSLVILTSDHGEEFWDHGRYYHGHSMYNEVLSVPLIIKPPGGKESKRVDTQVSLNNVMPTILDYCNISLGKKELYVDSLLPFFNSHTDTGNNGTPPPVVCSGVLYGEKRKALFFDRYKYIISENSQKEELFDLNADPFEQNLLNGRMPDRLQEAREILENLSRVSNKIKKLFKITGDKKNKTDKKESDKLNKLEALGYL
jgi:arylsulfatase A-like enzyme